MITPKQIEKLYKWAGWIDIRNKPYHQLGANWQKDHEIYPDLPPADLNTFEKLILEKLKEKKLRVEMVADFGTFNAFRRGSYYHVAILDGHSILGSGESDLFLNEACWNALWNLVEKKNG